MTLHGKTALALLFLAFGIFLAYKFPYASEAAGLALVIFFCNLVIGLLASKRGAKTFISPLIAIAAIFLFAGIMRAELAEDKLPVSCEATCSVQGTIIREPEMRDTYQRAVISVDDDRAHVEVYLPLFPRYQVGDTLLLRGIIKEPEILYPHGDEMGFDYVSYLRNKNIGSQMMFPKIELIDDAPHSPFVSLKRIKTTIASKISAYVRYPESTIASGMLLGSNDIPKSINDIFRTAGVSHIVVLSGFNIAIIVSFALLLLKYVPLIFRIVASSALVTLFVIMVGGEASVIRAAIMALIALLALAFGRPYVAKQALLISLLLISLYDPYSLLYDVSLHLSFIATAGIIYASNAAGLVTDIIKIPHALKETFRTTLAAYVATVPYQMYAFGSVSLYALVANIIIVPIVPLAMLFSFATAVVSYASDSAAIFFGIITSSFISLMLAFINLIARLPFSSIALHVSFGGMVLAYVFLVTSLTLLVRRKNETSLSASGVTHDETVYTY